MRNINLNNIFDEEIKACKREVKPIHINLVKEGDVHVGVLPFTLTSGEYLHTSAGLKEEIVTVTSEHSLLSYPDPNLQIKRKMAIHHLSL